MSRRCAVLLGLLTITGSAVLTTAPTPRLAAETLARPDTPVVVTPEDVRFRNGELTLGGLWFVPEGEGPFPAAVFIRGSGPSSRDSYWARSFVDVLLAKGFAVLLPDKRGSDASEGDWRTAGFDDLAGDALARSRDEVDTSRVGLVGLSQGGKIAPLAASWSEAVAFVIDVVGAATTLAEQVSWEMYHTFREAGVRGAALENALTLQVLGEGYLRGEVDWRTYEGGLREALAGPAADVARGFPQTADAWQWQFFRRVMDYDPIPHWRKVTQPVLVLYGEDDHNAPTVRSVYRLIRVWRETGHAAAGVRVFEGAGHALWDPDSDPHRPRLHPDVIATLDAWLDAHVRRARP